MDLHNLHLGVMLAVTFDLRETLAAAHADHADLLVAAVGENFGFDTGAP